jgi:hypothetical protein
MKLPDIIYHFVIHGEDISEDDRVKIVLREVPYLAYEAGVLSEIYFESGMVRHNKPWTRKYVLRYHEFDSVEVGRLVRALKNFVLNSGKEKSTSV